MYKFGDVIFEGLVSLNRARGPWRGWYSISWQARDVCGGGCAYPTHKAAIAALWAAYIRYAGLDSVGNFLHTLGHQMEMDMTRTQARYLASFDPDYSARCIRGVWVVWSAAADHAVEFDRIPDLDHCGEVIVNRRQGE